MSFFFITLTALMALVVALDASRYLIPNWLVALVAALYAAMVFTAPVQVEWTWALLVAASLFLLGLLVFALRLMGGGDVKLLAACGLWTGFTALPDFLLLTAIFGGLLSLALIFVRPLVPWVWHAEPLPKLLRKGAPVPYGIAIAAAFLVLLWRGELVGMGV